MAPRDGTAGLPAHFLRFLRLGVCDNALPAAFFAVALKLPRSTLLAALAAALPVCFELRAIVHLLLGSVRPRGSPPASRPPGAELYVSSRVLGYYESCKG